MAQHYKGEVTIMATETLNARQRIERDYQIVNGVIRSPGRFEGEAIYVPYFWESYLDGMADYDDGRTLGFKIEAIDRQLFPEISKRKRTIRLYQRDDGFVCEC